MPHRLTDSIGVAHLFTFRFFFFSSSVAYHSLMTRYFKSIHFADLVRGHDLNPFPIILCRRGPFQGSSWIDFIHEGQVGSGGVGAWCGGAGCGGQEWGAVTRPRNEHTMEVHPTVSMTSRMTIYFFSFIFSLSSFWTSRSHRCRPSSPPGSCLQILSRIGFSNPTPGRFFIECC